jgi:hypothetical protein
VLLLLLPLLMQLLLSLLMPLSRNPFDEGVEHL